MFTRFKRRLAPDRDRDRALDQARVAAMHEALGEASHVDRDADRDAPIDIHAFGRNFVEECSGEADDEGCILVTSGMSDSLMPVPEDCDDESAAVELVWYVRDLDPEYFSNLRWLAKLPRLDRTWFGIGHTVPMPQPPLSFSGLDTFLLLPPIIRTDRQLFAQLQQQGHAIGTLAVHLLHRQEYATITQRGLDSFLDLLDEHDYPFIFDPVRPTLC